MPTPEEQIESLQDRVASIEKTISRFSYITAAVGLCLTIFLGYTYTEIPKKIREAMSGRVLSEAEAQAKQKADDASRAASQAAIDAAAIHELVTQIPRYIRAEDTIALHAKAFQPVRHLRALPDERALVQPSGDPDPAKDKFQQFVIKFVGKPASDQ